MCFKGPVECSGKTWKANSKSRIRIGAQQTMKITTIKTSILITWNINIKTIKAEDVVLVYHKIQFQVLYQRPFIQTSFYPWSLVIPNNFLSTKYKVNIIPLAARGSYYNRVSTLLKGGGVWNTPLVSGGPGGSPPLNFCTIS